MQSQMTQNDIRREGIQALVNSLGPVGMIRFMSQFDKGSGDYTKEREKLLEDINGKGIDYIVEQINIMRKREELENNRDTKK